MMPPTPRSVRLALACAALLPAAACLARAPHVLTPQDVFALQHAEDAQISPDGKSVAYVRAAEDIMADTTRRSVWSVDPATGEQRPLIPGTASSPRWSPDGKRLAYLAPDPHGSSQIFVCQAGAGVGGQITDGSEAAGTFAWSPDGQQIAFQRFVPEEAPSLGGSPLQKPPGAVWAAPPRIITALRYETDGGGYTRPGHTHLFVVAADGGAARQITAGPYDEAGAFSWMPDGRGLLFSTNREEDRERDLFHSQIFRVDVPDGKLTQLTSGPGMHQEAVPSPDGRLIAYTAYDFSQEVEIPKLYLIHADGTGVRPLEGSLEGFVSQPRWAADGRGLYLYAVERGVAKILFQGLEGHAATLVEGLDDDRAEFSVSAAGTLACVLRASDHPDDVGVCAAGGTVQRLTRLNADLFADKILATVQPLPVRSSYDGLEIGAWVVLPPGYDPARRYPTILSMHGGPYGSYGPQWRTEFQLFAAAGYIVVYSNPRGSISYGLEFMRKIHHDFPNHDYDDLMSVVDAAVDKGIADPARLFVTGGSAGGQLTAWIVGKTDRFRAAVAEKPVIDVARAELSSAQYLFAKELFGVFPWEDPLVFWRHSPLSLVGNVKTPTMLIVGEEDRRTPPGESLQYYAALQLRGVPTALVLIPGAGHESFVERPSHLAAEAAIILDWFGRHGGIAAPSSAR